MFSDTGEILQQVDFDFFTFKLYEKQNYGL